MKDVLLKKLENSIKKLKLDKEDDGIFIELGKIGIQQADYNQSIIYNETESTKWNNNRLLN